MFFYLEWIDKRPDKILIVDELPTCKEINYKETFIPKVMVLGIGT